MDAGPFHFPQNDAATALKDSGYIHSGPLQQPRQYSDTPSADTAADAASYGMPTAAPSTYGMRQVQASHYVDPVTSAAQVSAAQALGAQAFGGQAVANQSVEMPHPHPYVGQSPSMADNYNHSAYGHSAYGAYSSVSQRPPAHRRSGTNGRPAASSHAKSRYTDKASMSAKSGVRSSTSEKTPVDQDGSRSLIANGLSACSGDSVKTMAMELFIPIIMMAASALMHHSGHTKSDFVVPFTGSKWYNRVNNALYGISTYCFFKRVGLFKSITAPIPTMPMAVDGTRSLTKQKTAAPPPPASAAASGRHARSVRRCKSEMRSAAAADTQSLFGASSTYSALGPDSESQQQYQEHLQCLVSEFDARWAVPPAVAKHYYNEVYRNKGGLNNANAEVMGGAAAIRAIRKVAWHADRHESQEASDRAVMDCALAEATSLLARKAAVAPLAADEIVENVGRFALATIIQIKVGGCQDDAPAH